MYNKISAFCHFTQTDYNGLSTVFIYVSLSLHTIYLCISSLASLSFIFVIDGHSIFIINQYSINFSKLSFFIYVYYLFKYIYTDNNNF